MGILVSLAFIRAVELVELSLIVGSSLEEKSKLLFSNVDSVSYLWVTEINWEKKKVTCLQRESQLSKRSPNLMHSWSWQLASSAVLLIVSKCRKAHILRQLSSLNLGPSPFLFPRGNTPGLPGQQQPIPSHPILCFLPSRVWKFTGRTRICNWIPHKLNKAVPELAYMCLRATD